MNDPVIQYVYWYYVGGIVLLALLSLGFYKWYQNNKQHSK